jgi:kynurenine formamidase
MPGAGTPRSSTQPPGTPSTTTLRSSWEGHRAGREIGYCHLEKLHGLDRLPDTGFEISCFPVKIQAASAGWTRAVAVLES